MKRSLILIATSMGMMLMLFSPILAAEQPKPFSIVMGGGSIGGTVNQLATAWIEQVKRRIPGVTIDLPPGGTVTNILRLGQKKIDIGWATSSTVGDAYKGRGPQPQFKGGIKNLRGIATVYVQHYQIVASPTLDAKTIDDVIEKKMKVRWNPGGPRGHVGVYATSQLLEARWKLTYKDLEKNGVKIIYGEFTDAIAMLKDGHLDLFTPLTAAPNGAILELAATKGMKLLALTPEDQKVMEEYGYPKGVLKAGTYEQIKYDVPTCLGPYGIFTREGEDPEVVYQMTKVLLESKPNLAAAHKIMTDWNPATAWEYLPVPLHPGAEKAYKEKGYVK
jgi:TRAP transporter TAXI family solute receptor